MNLPIRLSALFFSAALVASCAGASSDPANDGDALDLDESDLDETSDAARAAVLYYSLRHDYRRCVSPLCGGYWVKRVNKPNTRCADGRYRDECYVAELSAATLPAHEITGGAIVRGSLSRKDYGNFGRLGVLEVLEAWRPGGAGTPTGNFYRLRDNAVRCITFPCYWIGEARLNTSRIAALSGVDLTATGASQDVQAEAFQALGTGDLVAVGTNRSIPDQGPAGDGLELFATEVYLPIRAPAPNACTMDDECGYSMYPALVTSPAECYCPTCPTPMTLVEAEANRASWDQHCAGLRCMPPPCAPPPPVGCVNGTCAYSFGP